MSKRWVGEWKNQLIDSIVCVADKLLLSERGWVSATRETLYYDIMGPFLRIHYCFFPVTTLIGVQPGVLSSPGYLGWNCIRWQQPTLADVTVGSLALEWGEGQKKEGDIYIRDFPGLYQGSWQGFPLQQCAVLPWTHHLSFYYPLPFSLCFHGFGSYSFLYWLFDPFLISSWWVFLQLLFLLLGGYIIYL